VEITSGIGWHDRARLDCRAPEWATTLNPTECARFLGFLKGGNRAEGLYSGSGDYTLERIYVRVVARREEWDCGNGKGFQVGGNRRREVSVGFPGPDENLGTGIMNPSDHSDACAMTRHHAFDIDWGTVTLE
jgi:hypothetical protein